MKLEESTFTIKGIILTILGFSFKKYKNFRNTKNKDISEPLYWENQTNNIKLYLSEVNKISFKNKEFEINLKNRLFSNRVIIIENDVIIAKVSLKIKNKKLNWTVTKDNSSYLFPKEQILNKREIEVYDI